MSMVSSNLACKAGRDVLFEFLVLRADVGECNGQLIHLSEGCEHFQCGNFVLWLKHEVWDLWLEL